MGSIDKALIRTPQNMNVLFSEKNEYFSFPLFLSSVGIVYLFATEIVCNSPQNVSKHL